MRIPKNKGTVGANRQGRIILTNPGGNSFVVHVAVAYIWEKADGKNTIDDITRSLTEDLEITSEDQDEANNVVLTLRSLEKKDLIEYIERR